MAVLLEQVGLMYNYAKVAVENDGLGHGLNQMLKERYFNLYCHMIPDGWGFKMSSKPGFEMTSISRLESLNIAQNLLIANVHRCTDYMPCAEMVREYSTMIYKSNGKLEAAEGCHDDLPMADAICLKVCEEEMKFNPEIAKSSMEHSRVEKADPGPGDWRSVVDMVNDPRWVGQEGYIPHRNLDGPFVPRRLQ
jgi:hypothetical protein